MFFLNSLNPTIRITQGDVLKVTDALVIDGALELDESVVLPLTDSVLTLAGIESVAAFGVTDGLFGPSLVSLRDSGLYFAARLHGEAWADLTLTEQAQALLLSTQFLNQLGYIGYLANDNQLLEWPRVLDRCPPSASIFPQSIKFACAELALSLSASSGTEPVASELNKFRVTSRRFSSVATTYGAALAPPNLDAGIVSVTAWKLLEPYLRSGRLVRLHRAS